MKSFSEQIKDSPWKGWILFIATIVIVFFLGLLASSIIDRRSEAIFAYAPDNDFSQFESRNEVWGENFPREYESYMRTSDTTFRSKYNGSEMIDELEDDPNLVILWAGYGFSKEYNQGRGHYFAIDDMHNILRTGAPGDGVQSPMPNTCWTCKSPDVPRLMNKHGVAEFYKGQWERWGPEVVNHIGCGDCHDVETMQLKITRPALIEAFERQGKNIAEASHQEMRSLVCAQCHVEYYFSKTVEKGVSYLVFPWDLGTGVDEMEVYYDEIGFSDWTHKLSKAPMLKAQHPGYEVYLTGVHASRGVSCADCHMPYKSEGGVKFTDHHLQSPLNNISNSCQVCHREETERLMEDVFSRQDKIKQNIMVLEDLIVKAHIEAKFAWDRGATEDQMTPILVDIRHAQWRWDYSVAGHGGSFHSPVETGRIVSTGINLAQESRLKLARVLAELGYNREVVLPDISTKDKAQEYIGLDMDKLNGDKQNFLKSIIPGWLSQAKERESGY
ncbi:MAG: ammonia-forming cytochrome c nitrite reductase [Bacteroidales bacterium]|nr:ammonia-forming cytochrome c nitrite reductase [Bacteroidales bacterium]